MKVTRQLVENAVKNDPGLKNQSNFYKFLTVNFDILFDILEDETFCQEIQETDSFIEDVGFYDKLSEYS